MKDAPDGEEQRTSQTVEFNFNPEVDTADGIAQDLGDEFNLSPTDRWDLLLVRAVAFTCVSRTLSWTHCFGIGHVGTLVSHRPPGCLHPHNEL